MADNVAEPIQSPAAPASGQNPLEAGSGAGNIVKKYTGGAAAVFFRKMILSVLNFIKFSVTQIVGQLFGKN